MKSKKIKYSEYLLGLISVIVFAALLTFAADSYKRQEMPDCSNEDTTISTPTQNPLRELTFCDQYKATPDRYKDDFYVRGWPYSYSATAPPARPDDPDLDKLHQAEYAQERQGAIVANFVIYLGASMVIYVSYLVLRTRYAHHRH